MARRQLSNLQKFRLLLWKNFNTLGRQPFQLFLMFLLPLLLSSHYIVFRRAISYERRVQSTYFAINIASEWEKLKQTIESRRKHALKINPKSNVFIPIMKIAFAPNNNDTTLNTIRERVKSKLAIPIDEFPNCIALQKQMANGRYFAGVCFQSKLLKQLKYTILMPSELRIYNDTYIGADWSTNELYDVRYATDMRVGKTNAGAYVGYVREGFIPIQESISAAYVHDVKRIAAIPHILLRRLSFQNYISDHLTTDCQQIISLVVLGGYLLPILQGVWFLVSEKEIKRRRLYKNMGVQNALQVASWCVLLFVLLFLISFFYLCFLKIRIDKTKSAAVFTNSSFAILFLVFLIYNFACIAFCAMMSSFFKSASRSVVVTGIVWIVTFIPYLPGANTQSFGFFTKFFTFWFSNTVFGLTFTSIASLEEYHDGVDWNNLFKKRYKNHHWSVGMYMMIMLGLAFFYLLVAIGFETDWRRCTCKRQKKKKGASNETESDLTSDLQTNEPPIVISNLRHRYEDGNIVLTSIFLKLYANEIVVLMGHNGAGKSTLISLLTGMEDIQAGSIIIDGVEMSKNREKICMDIGQLIEKEQFLEDLTVADQLLFFGRLKGMTFRDLQTEMQRYLEALEMLHKKNVLINKLSFGYKKQLGILCALIGRSRYVFLDEPTSGLDYNSCRLVWNLLKAEKESRTILITSHSANEAEAVSDRVVIMARGAIKSTGSTGFLKQTYGSGFRLTCLKDDNADIDAMTELLQKYIPGISPESNIGRLLTYKIPADHADKVEPISDELESKKFELKLETFAVDQPSMEDIFFELGTGNQLTPRRDQILKGETVYGKDIDELEFLLKHHKQKRCSVIGQKYHAMILKIWYSQDHKLVSVLLFLMPFAFTYLFLILTHHKLSRNFLKPINFGLKQYPKTVSLVGIDDSNKQLVKNFKKMISSLGEEHTTLDVEKLLHSALEQQRKEIDRFNRINVIGITPAADVVRAWFNNFPLHAAPLSLNMAHNTLLSQKGDENNIELRFAPLNYSGPVTVAQVPKHNFVIFLCAYNVSFMLIFLCMQRVMFLVKERTHHYTLHQIIAGMRFFTFWIPTFIYDLFQIIILASLVVIFCALSAHNILGTSTVLGSFWILIVVTGICITSLNYFLCICFRDEINAYMTLISFYLFGMVSALGTSREFHPKYHDFSDTLHIFLQTVPTYNLADGLFIIYELASRKAQCSDANVQLMSKIENCKIAPRCCQLGSLYSLSTGVGIQLLILAAFTVVSWILLFICDNFKYGKRLHCCCPIRKDDM